jgi:hypothetical protein
MSLAWSADCNFCLLHVFVLALVSCFGGQVRVEEVIKYEGWHSY